MVVFSLPIPVRTMSCSRPVSVIADQRPDGVRPCEVGYGVLASLQKTANTCVLRMLAIQPASCVHYVFQAHREGGLWSKRRVG